VELRQLRYFVAVAEELSFSRAAVRLRIAAPSLSQQIKALERDLKVQLFNRDNRSTALTADGAALLPNVRLLVSAADELSRRAAGLSHSEPVRIGYVNWYPAELSQQAATVAELRVDNWILPSHLQATRVAEGNLDLAICWVETTDLIMHQLEADLIGIDTLYAVSTGLDGSPVKASDTLVLIDRDTEAWSSWNRYAEHYASQIGALALHVNSGVVGPSFYQHVRGAGRPVLNNPKTQNDPLPHGLVRRSVIDPTPLWTWSLVRRRSERRPAVYSVIRELVRGVIQGVTAPSLDDNEYWLPPADPHRRVDSSVQQNHD
jgi:DNA-binding transcriptional LysR family regulator